LSARSRALAAAIAFALAGVLAGCEAGSRVDRATFAKIETDMPESEVYALLGEPADTSSFSLGGLSATSATWEGRDGKIAIQFLNGKVAFNTFTSDPAAEGS
jgi:hypothetical protein